MRPVSLVSLLIVCASCAGAVLRPPPGVKIALKANVRVDVRVAPPAPVVALTGAPVVEFFGVPLDDAQDVIFVLDCSGSMAERALGQLAHLAAPPPPATPPSIAPTTIAPVVPPPTWQPAPTAAPGTAPPPTWQPPPGGQPPGGQPPGTPPVIRPAPTQTAQTASPTDAASAMGPRKIDVAQAELIDALARLPAGTRTNIIFFNDHLEALAPGLIPLDPAARPAYVDFVDSRLAVGGTALTPAMRMAFLMNPRRIVLLSDGLGNVGGKAPTLLRDAREAIRGGVRIDTIGLGAGQDASLLLTLATESGGLYQRL